MSACSFPLSLPLSARARRRRWRCAARANRPVCRLPRRNRQTRSGVDRPRCNGEQGAFGQHQIGSAGDTEVGAAVADHDRQLARGARGEVALAVARQRPAVAARMREGEPPAIVAAPLQMVGGEGQLRQSVAPQHSLDRAVEPVRHHSDVVAKPGAQRSERRKPRIDLNAGDKVVHFGLAGADEIDLAHHAFARADQACLPVLLDTAPSGVGEALEQQVRRVDGRDGSVEIDQQAVLHTHTRHVDGTR